MSYKPNRLVKFTDNWLGGWLDMLCGLICIITFTLWRPWWDFQVRFLFSKYYAKKAKEYSHEKTGNKD